MILTCPSCAERYRTPDDSIGPNGRPVRCAKCGHSWYVGPDGEAMSPAETAPAKLTRAEVERQRAQVRAPHEEAREKAKARQKQTETLNNIKVWAISGGVFVSLLVFGVFFRNSVAKVWPQSASVFAAVGLQVNATGLEISNIKVERAFDGTIPVLAVGGQIKNVGGKDQIPPPIHIRVLNAGHKEVFSWTVIAQANALARGKTAVFSGKIANPPIDAQLIEIQFGDAVHTKSAGKAHGAKGKSEAAAAHGAAPHPAAGHDDGHGGADDAHAAAPDPHAEAHPDAHAAPDTHGGGH